MRYDTYIFKVGITTLKEAKIRFIDKQDEFVIQVSQKLSLSRRQTF